jgi:co-chaperonin GroES (HSP10)
MQINGNSVEFSYDGIDEAFPHCDAGVKPFGSRVLCQIRTPKTKTKGGIILTGDVRETEHYNTQVAKVVAVGTLAYRNRNTMEMWPEGAWCALGDFVRSPKYGGDRWTVKLDDEEIEFAMFDDLNILGRVKGDPRKIRAFI